MVMSLFINSDAMCLYVCINIYILFEISNLGGGEASNLGHYKWELGETIGAKLRFRVYIYIYITNVPISTLWSLGVIRSPN